MIGLYYVDYCERAWPRSARKMIICYTRLDALKKIKEKNIPDSWFLWLSECRTPGYLVEGLKPKVIDWIMHHMPKEISGPLR